MTRDVDITLLCPFGSESAAVERLRDAFRPRVEDARGFALRARVVPRTRCAEDLVTLKTVAGGPKDWEEVERILVRSRRTLDWALTENERARRFCSNIRAWRRGR